MENSGDNLFVLPQSKIAEQLYTGLLNERKITIEGEIDDCIISDVVLQIMRFNKADKGLKPEDRKPIILYFSSVGGSVFEGLPVVDVIKNSKTPVYGVVMSYAWSMASCIYSVCHKRYMFKHSTILLHDGTLEVRGSAGKVKDTQKFLDKIENVVKDIFLEHSSISDEEFTANLDREWYMFPKECVEKGLCEGIVGVDIDFDEIL